MTAENNLEKLSKEEIFRIITWAEKLSQLYEIELVNIIARFIQAHKFYKNDIDASMRFCEAELNIDYIALMTSGVNNYEYSEIRNYQAKNQGTSCIK